MTSLNPPALKRVRSDRSGWRKSSRRGYHCRKIDTLEISGYVIFVVIDKLDSPWMCRWGGEHYCIADIGYSWLSYFPKGEGYVAHVVYDAQGRLIHWYVDICLQTGVDCDGVPFFDDLFLDVVMLPSGKHALLDDDELYGALRDGIISESIFTQAREKAIYVTKAIKDKSLPFFYLVPIHYKEFRSLIQ